MVAKFLFVTDLLLPSRKWKGDTADLEADQKQQFQNISVLFAKMEIEFS